MPVVCFQVCKEAGEGKNAFMSPISLTTALALVYAGSKGNTAAQMRNTLKFSVPDPVKDTLRSTSLKVLCSL